MTGDSTGKSIEAILTELGFSAPLDVAERFSIADLFPRARRCGVYALAFKNGEYYVGRSVDVVQRFGHHRKSKDDIVSIAFKIVPKDQIAQAEKETIRRLEREGARLRNIDDMTVVLGETDLDVLMVRDLQHAWLEDDTFVAKEAARPNDHALRRRLQHRWDDLAKFEDADETVEVLRRYVTTCIPEPCRTELAFWSVSCLPENNTIATLVFRVNVNRQEVFAFYDSTDQSDPSYYFQVRRSLFAEGLRNADRLPQSLVLENVWYKSGGPDQIRVIANDIADVLGLLELPWFRRTVKDMNLNLMRKGGNLYAGSHCFALVDAVWRASPKPLLKNSLTENVWGDDPSLR